MKLIPYYKQGDYVMKNLLPSSTVKPAHVVTSIKQSPVLKGHLYLALS
jgi:hypothetical protein